MKCTLLSLAISLIPAFTQESFGRSPDQVAHSPIPKLRAPYRYARRNQATRQAVNVRFVRDAVSAEGSDTRSAETRAQASDFVPSEYPNGVDWQLARSAVLKFARRSSQTSIAEAEQFLDRLSNLSAEEKNDWLRRYKQRRESISRAERSRQQARRERWIDRERQQQDRIVRVTQLQAVASWARNSQTSAISIAKAKPFSHVDFEALVRPGYNPLIPILDPSSPQGDVARAASLLGESFAESEAAAAASTLAVATAADVPTIPAE